MAGNRLIDLETAEKLPNSNCPHLVESVERKKGLLLQLARGMVGQGKGTGDVEVDANP